MSRPHHPTPEAIELTEGEKSKIMNDFLLNRSALIQEIIQIKRPATLSTKTLDELSVYNLALAVAHVKCKGLDPTRAALEELAAIVENARKDKIFERQQLPY